MKRIVGKMWKALIALIEVVVRRIQYKSRIENKIDASLDYSKNHERRLLRLEIIEAIRRDDRAVVHQLYDEYTSIGGNSYMNELYKNYCKKPTKRRK